MAKKPSNGHILLMWILSSFTSDISMLWKMKWMALWFGKEVKEDSLVLNNYLIANQFKKSIVYLQLWKKLNYIHTMLLKSLSKMELFIQNRLFNKKKILLIKNKSNWMVILIKMERIISFSFMKLSVEFINWIGILFWRLVIIKLTKIL